jgi:hypothetical protein
VPEFLFLSWHILLSRSKASKDKSSKHATRQEDPIVFL